MRSLNCDNNSHLWGFFLFNKVFQNKKPSGNTEDFEVGPLGFEPRTL